MFKKSLAFCICVMLSTSAFALEAQVVRTGLWGNGGLFIVLESTYELAGCSSPEIWVASNHPSKNHILSVAMAAVASGKRVGIVVGGCSGPGGRPLFTESTDSYIYLKQ